MKAISQFRGEFRFLSNFYPATVVMDGFRFTDTEAAFQSQKEPEKAHMFEGLDPAASKALGRKVNIRSDWDEVKDDVMRRVVRLKFEQNTDLRKRLIDTGDAVLIEGDNWHDNYWGACTCEGCERKKGKNMLGNILMELRSEFQKQGSDND